MRVELRTQQVGGVCLPVLGAQLSIYMLIRTGSTPLCEIARNLWNGHMNS
jgi:hypothetical protein